MAKVAAFAFEGWWFVVMYVTPLFYKRNDGNEKYPAHVDTPT